MYFLGAVLLLAGAIWMTVNAAKKDLISPDPQPPVAGCASPTAEHTAT